MKKKYIAILLGITLGMTTLVGCSRTNTSESSTIQESQSVTGATENSDKRVSEAETADVYGEVTAVSEDSITIKVGTMKQREKPDNAGAPGDSSNAQSSDDKTDSDSTEKSASKSESPRHVYREAIMTDGILVENIIQEINRLAETGTSDLGAVIFRCENA